MKYKNFKFILLIISAIFIIVSSQGCGSSSGESNNDIGSDTVAQNSVSVYVGSF